MKPIEREMILGMTSILNEAASAYYDGKPIITNEQYDARLEDLKQLEEETGYMLTNSPNQNNKAETTYTYIPTNMDECNTIDRLIEFSNGDKMVSSAVLKGIKVSLRYINGTLVSIETNEDCCYFEEFKNIPYKIGKDVTCVVKGMAILIDKTKLYFYADNMIDGSDKGIYDNLKKAEELGFDIVPIWNAAKLNPKTIQSFVDFAYDYIEDEADMPCDGIVFRFNNIDNKPLRYEGIIYKRN